MGGTRTCSAVEVSQARAAAADYLRTGDSPDGVAWKAFEVSDDEPTEGFPGRVRLNDR